MEDSEARQLLIDAGVSEDRIDATALIIASAIADGLARAVAKRMAEKLVEAEFSDMLQNIGTAKERWAKRGIIIE